MTHVVHPRIKHLRSFKQSKDRATWQHLSLRWNRIGRHARAGSDGPTEG
jgi:hypothetical protein